MRAVIRRDGVTQPGRARPVRRTTNRTRVPHGSTGSSRSRLSDGTIDLLNNLRRHPVERHFSPVRFLLQDFRTTAEGGRFNLTARSQQNEVFAWKGRFALEPEIASTGAFTFTDLRVPGVTEFIGDDLPMLLPRGDIDLGGTYDLEVGDTVDLEVALPRIAVNDAALRARGVQEDWVEIPLHRASDTRLAVPELTVAVGSIVVQGLTAHVWMEPDGTLNVDRLFAAPTAAPVDATPVAGQYGGVHRHPRCRRKRHRAQPDGRQRRSARCRTRCRGSHGAAAGAL